jgi:hypothetical protein
MILECMAMGKPMVVSAAIPASRVLRLNPLAILRTV